MLAKKWFGMLMALAVPLSAAAWADPVRAQEKVVVLRGITPWSTDYYWTDPFIMFQKLVNQRLKGRVSVSYLGADEVVPPFEQIEALRNGVVDVILGASSYYTGQIPEALGVLYAKLPPSKLRQNGFYDLMRKVHLEKGNVVYLANVGGAPGTAFRLFSKVKIDKPDLTGLKIRVTPVYIELVKALGGSPINMKPSEVYTALERGIVDGYGWSYGGITDFAWHEVTKYVIDEPFYTANTAILINKAAWDKLPGDVKQTLEEIGVELEKRAEKAMADRNAKEDALLKSKGLQFIKFSPADAKKFRDTAYDAAWKAYIAKNPEFGPKLKALSE